MNRRKLLAAATTAALAAVCSPIPFARISTAGMSHPFHATALELEWNAETDCFEAALLLPGPPLDEELARFAGRPVPLDAADPRKHADNEKLLADWIRSRLKLTADSLPLCDIHWVGSELEPRSVWAYFEIRLRPEPPAETLPVNSTRDINPEQRRDEHPGQPVRVGPDSNLSLHCRFFDHLPGQVNAATIQIGSRRSSVFLSEINQSAAVSWDAPARPSR